jgi:hypothetical protein
MNYDEGIVYQYLTSLSLGEVVYEPDGRLPPDFLIDGRIAVEARRLNQHYEVAGRPRSLEQDRIPIVQGFENLLAKFKARDTGNRTWFVSFNFSRPLPPWRELRRQIHVSLDQFLQIPGNTIRRILITDRFSITIGPRASEFLGAPFVAGTRSDFDEGGFMVSEVVRNAEVYIAEKTAKVAPHRHKYPTWWLVFVDYIARPEEATDVRKYLQRPGEWDRLIILSPKGRAYDI